MKTPMNRIYQMHPRRPSTKLERWWGYTKQKEVQGGKLRAKPPRSILQVVYRKRSSIDPAENASILLKTASTQCLGSYICQVLKVIYILHWIPFFRKFR